MKDTLKDISELLKEEPVITYNSVKESGISKYSFNKLINEEGFEKVGHGLYLSKNELIDELYIIHKRCPIAVFSHDEAFFYHNLVDREPLVHTFTIYSGYNAHRLKEKSNYKIYNVKKELIDVGKIIVKDSYGNDIPMYDLERTVCDLVRSRNSIEINEFTTALKAYVARKDKNLNLLMEYAKLFSISNIIRKYMEVLL